MPNIRNVINAHNKKILETENEAKRTCNCRNKTNCPFNYECLLKDFYIAKVRKKEYIGSTGNFFKTRWQQHKHSILKKTQSTALAKFTAINNIDFSEIKWLILFKTNCLAPRNTNSCSICNLERMAIAEADRDKALNVRKELATTCPHHRSSYF